VRTSPGSWLRENAWTLAASIVVLTLGLLNGIRRSIWIDEAYTLLTGHRSFAGTLQRALDFELQPPLYFLLLNLWTRLSPSIEWARVFSTASALASVWVLASLAKVLHLGRRAPSLPLVAALCPFVLWTASEARSYALTLLLSACATLFFARLWNGEDARTWPDALLYVLFGYLALLNFYFSGFLVLGQLSAGMLVRRHRRWALACGLGLAVLLLPWAPIVLAQARRHPVENPDAFALEAPWLVRGLVRAAITLGSVLFLDAPVIQRPAFVALLLLTMTILLAARAFPGSGRLTSAERALGLATAVPFVAVMGLKALNLASVEKRHFVVCVVGALSLLMLLLEQVREPWRRGIGLLLLGVFALGAVSFQRNNAAPSDWRGAAAILEARARPSEPLVFFEPSVQPFLYYYRGASPVYGLPRDENLELFDRSFFVVRSSDEVDRRIGELLGPRQTFWLILNGRNPNTGGPIVLDYLEKRLEILETSSVRGAEILHVRRQPDTMESGRDATPLPTGDRREGGPGPRARPPG